MLTEITKILKTNRKRKSQETEVLEQKSSMKQTFSRKYRG